MADEQLADEEIIIIEEADATNAEAASSSTANAPSEEKGSSSKKTIIIMAGVLVLLLAGGGITFALLSSGSHDEEAVYEAPLKKVPTQDSKIDPSELEKMINRANELYANGNQAEALKLFEQIALYSEAISQYNLGVVQLKGGEYEGALQNFKRSIANSENRCVSAINAAVCSLHLKQPDNFNYYIDLAQAYLINETNSPMYSYYYALIHYYKGHYYEALSALNHPTTEEYPTIQSHLKTAINTLYQNFKGAIASLESISEEKNAFALGTLYANTGNLTEAKKHLSNAIIHNPKPIEETLALAFVDLKLGQHLEASALLKSVVETYPDQAYTPYPIKVTLKPELFHPDSIQKEYRKKIASDHKQTYQNIFYFAPYKIFNATQTLGYLQKGNANIYIDDTATAKEYLEKSINASGIDYGIAFAIQKALQFRLRESNKEFGKLLASHPQHSVLQYNMGLTCAQMGDYTNAYEHFLRGYHLDAKNYLSGIFAIMSAELCSKKNPKLISILKESLAQEQENEEMDLYRTLLSISENNYPAASRWLDNRYKARPLYLAMNIIISQNLNMDSNTRAAAKKLIQLQPNDILPHMLYIDSAFKEMSPKAYALAAQSYLRKQNFSYNDLYYGPQLSRERGIQMAAITGMLTPLINRLEDKLQTTASNTSDITSALALAHFYNQSFEKSYALYNQVIDTHKVQDEKTLFMGASAAIASEHYENAIPLLELSKMKNPNYLENRYALGLLYMQVENYPAAVIQFRKMGNTGFKSSIFDFSIDTDKLATESNRYHAL